MSKQFNVSYFKFTIRNLTVAIGAALDVWAGGAALDDLAGGAALDVVAGGAVFVPTGAEATTDVVAGGTSCVPTDVVAAPSPPGWGTSPPVMGLFPGSLASVPRTVSSTSLSMVHWGGLGLNVKKLHRVVIELNHDERFVRQTLRRSSKWDRQRGCSGSCLQLSEGHPCPSHCRSPHGIHCQWHLHWPSYA